MSEEPHDPGGDDSTSGSKRPPRERRHDDQAEDSSKATSERRRRRSADRDGIVERTMATVRTFGDSVLKLIDSVGGNAAGGEGSVTDGTAVPAVNPEPATQSTARQLFLTGVTVYTLVGLSIGVANYALVGSMLGRSGLGSAIVAGIVSLVVVFALPLVSMAMAGMIGLHLRDESHRRGIPQTKVAAAIAGAGHLLLYVLGYGITSIRFLNTGAPVDFLDGALLNVLFALQAAVIAAGVLVVASRLEENASQTRRTDVDQ